MNRQTRRWRDQAPPGGSPPRRHQSREEHLRDDRTADWNRSASRLEIRCCWFSAGGTEPRTGRPVGTADSAWRNWRPQGDATVCTRCRRSSGSPRDVRRSTRRPRTSSNGSKSRSRCSGACRWTRQNVEKSRVHRKLVRVSSRPRLRQGAEPRSDQVRYCGRGSQLDDSATVPCPSPSSSRPLGDFKQRLGRGSAVSDVARMT